MIKSFSKLVVAGAAIAALSGAAFAGPNDGPVAQSPAGTFLGSATLWAVVNANGTVARSDGHLSVTTSGTGNYIVRFRRNVRGCAYIATIGLTGASGTSAPGFITVVGAAVDPRGVFVTTDNTAGTSTDLGFHLFVNC